MSVARRIIQFWIDFIIGDAWEVALGIGLSIAVIAFAVDRFGRDTLLAFALLASVLLFSGLAIMRATSSQRA